MRSARFKLALERLQPSDWKRFEDLASKFLATEYSGLRTVASGSGDRGRDAFLFTLTDDPSTVFQYSVAGDWDDKIVRTARRIHKEFPNATVLIYVTSQEIGAAADRVRARLRQEFGLHLDVRDRHWFVERAETDRQRETAAEDLAKAIVDPYLASKDVVERKALALTGTEAQAAIVHLGLQLEDDTREKGLTRLSFEALVRSSLRETTPENRKTRDTVKADVRRLLPTHTPTEVDARTDAALGRLTKRFVRHYQKSDEFCLTHDERVRLGERLAELETLHGRFHADVENVVRDLLDATDIPVPEEIEDVCLRVRRVLERFLLSRGERFVEAVKKIELHALGFDDIPGLVISDLGSNPDRAKLKAALPPVVGEAVRMLLREPSEATQHYLRLFSDAYTLFAFLHETPDVQDALVKLFSYGNIWLDTTIVLPVFVEELLEPSARRFSNMLQAAQESGQKLYMTRGVLEEIQTHLERCIYCWRAKPGDWRGSVPFVYGAYIRNGQPISGFGGWVEQFFGASRPGDDIAEYLNEAFGIEIGSMEHEAAEMPADLRGAVQEIWYQAHERRRRAQKATEPDPITLKRLVDHDVENYLGVISKRGAEPRADLSYSVWWLTLDRVAFDVHHELRERIQARTPASPVMSPDFLVNYLVFGPVRRLVSKSTEACLPLVVELEVTEFLPPELIELAEKVRAECEGQPERIIKRRIRDAVDAAKRRRGRIAQAGLSEPRQPDESL